MAPTLIPRRKQSCISQTRSASGHARSSPPSRPMSPRDRQSRKRSTGSPVRRDSSSSFSASGIEQSPFAQNAAELHAPGGTIRLEVARTAHDEGDGVLTAVAHAEVKL